MKRFSLLAILCSAFVASNVMHGTNPRAYNLAHATEILFSQKINKYGVYFGNDGTYVWFEEDDIKKLLSPGAQYFIGQDRIDFTIDGQKKIYRLLSKYEANNTIKKMLSDIAQKNPRLVTAQVSTSERSSDSTITTQQRSSLSLFGLLARFGRYCAAYCNTPLLKKYFLS